MKILFALLISLIAHSQEYPVDQLRGIKIIGWRGQVQLMGDPKSELVRYNFKGSTSDGFSTSAQLVQGWLELRVNGPADKAQWRGELPSIHLDIRSKSLPVVLTWVEGDITVKNWQAPFQLTHKKGKVKIEDSSEKLKLSLHEGELALSRFTGDMDIDSYSARLALTKVNGRVKIENFQGRLTMDQSKGDLSLKTVQGKNVVEDLNGSFEFESTNGEITFTQGTGSVHGRANGGSVDGKISGAVELRIRGDEPKLNLQLMKGVGAKVDIGSTKGNISSRLPLKIERLENLRLMRGQLSGAKVSTLFVRLQSGDVRLR